MNLKPLLILPPLAIGILGFMAMNRAEAPPVETREESRLTVRVTPVEAGPLDVTATGYGRVEAVRNWTAVSQVAGRVIDGLDDLSEGALVDEGTVVLQIDPTDYELAVQKAQANIAAAQAALAELDRMEENSLRLLELEQDILDVAQAEYDRVKGLVDRGSNAVSSLDTAQKTLLAQENAVASITNTLALFPAQRASAEATLAVRQAELAEAERALENTTITAPFRGRISESSVEIGQYVSTGETLLSISGIDAAEIVASFPTSSFGAVALVSIGQTLQDVAEVDSSGIISFLTAAGVTATVQMDIADFSASWDAELVRFRGTIDSDTGTVGFAVRVEDPLAASSQVRRPPLNIGSFVSVTLHAQAPADTIAIPRAALHYDDAGAPFVYVADADDRLAIAPVTPGPVTGKLVLVRDGLTDGDRLILSDPRPPIPGIALTLVPDDGDS